MSNLPGKEQIHDNDSLLRRVLFRDPNFIKPDGKPASSCFTPRKGEDGLSVDIERLTTYKKSIRNRDRYRLFYLQASTPRKHGLEPEHNPTPDNIAHALIKGNVTRPIAKKLASAARPVDDC